VPFPWVDDLNIANRGWCYTHDIKYRSANEIIDGFVDRVSRGGGLMLSVSPKADGTIPAEQQQLLAELGNWLKINGEGIYGTRRWKIETEGPDDKLIVDNGKKTLWNFADTCDDRDFRFTRKGNTLYAFLLGWPKDGTAVIKSLGTKTTISTGEIAYVTMLGHDGAMKWGRTEDGLTVKLPETPSCNYAHGLKIEMQ
jgi:alpha-L-fucosidase